MAQDAYVSLLFTDGYLRGALVLAASLRDGGTTKKLAIVVPADEAHRLQPQTIQQLEESYDYVIPMSTFTSANRSNLALLQRPDLALTLTKINLWRLVQFRKCVYVDADILALRAPDELFTLDTDFAAAPDVGWPDIFNSGVFLFKPNMATYYALRTLAESGITFDGGDQGLLNTFFPAYHRLSFTYNVTPSSNYQYTPAYRHFSSNITFFHFIGLNKPWYQQGSGSGGSYNEASARWWSVYEKHFGWKIREDEYKYNQQAALHGEQRTRAEPSQQPYVQQPYVPAPPPPQTYMPPPPSYVQPALRHEPRPRSPVADAPRKQVAFGSTDTAFFHPSESPPANLTPSYHSPSYHAPPYHAPSSHAPPPPPPPREPTPPPFEPVMVNWDPARTAPPSDAGPEARNLTISSYESAWDKPYDPEEPRWVPPPPSPLPRGYEYTPPSPIATAASVAQAQESGSESEEDTHEAKGYHTSDSESPEDSHRGRQKARFNPVFPWEMRGPRAAATRIFPDDHPSGDVKPAAAEPGPRPYDRRASLEKYDFTNAWDHLPIIQSYVKQKLGEAPAPTTSVSEQIAATESQTTTPSGLRTLPNTMAVAAPDQGERWDPNKAVDNLKTGVLNRFREQQEAQKRSPTRDRLTKPPFPTSDNPASTEEEAGQSSSSTAAQIKIDEVHRLSTLTTVTGLIWMSLSAALTERAAAVVSTPG